MASPLSPSLKAFEESEKVRSETVQKDSIIPLIDRLDIEVSIARDRVETLQAAATAEFFVSDERMPRFMAVADHIHSILLPRLKALTDLDVFQGTIQTVSPPQLASATKRFHSRVTKLLIPLSDLCPAKVELFFRVSHDGSIENAVLEYQLEIIPIFIKFEKVDQLIIPINEPNQVAIETWIDNKLVEFTRTFFEIGFHEQYQKLRMESDPVMKMRFPKAFAAGSTEHEGKTYYFYSRRSLDLFKNAPAEYI